LDIDSGFNLMDVYCGALGGQGTATSHAAVSGLLPVATMANCHATGAML